MEPQMSKKIKVFNSDKGKVKSKGTVQKLNVHDTPQHAVVAERRNRTIAERVRAVFGKKPNLGDLREKVYVRLEKKGLKLGGRVREGRWLGVDEESKGARIYWPDTKSINVERNVYYDDMSASRNEVEQHDSIVTSSDLPTKIPNVKPLHSGKKFRGRKFNHLDK